MHRHDGEGAQHDENRRNADSQRFAKRRVAQVHARADADAVAFERGQLNSHLNEHTGRVADGDDIQRKLLVIRGHERVRQERDDDDQVVRHRSYGRPQVVAACVEQARHNSRASIEHDLYGEELEEEHRGGHLRLIGVEALRVDDRRGEQHAQKRNRSKQQHHERKQIRSVFVAGTLPQLLLHRNVHRQKRGDDHAAADQLVELVGKIVRHLIGA